MTPRQQHLHDLGKSVTTLASLILVALVGFIAKGEGFDDDISKTLLSVVYVALILTIIASMYSMHYISNRLVDKPKVGPRPAFVAANIALGSITLAMVALGVVGIVALQ